MPSVSHGTERTWSPSTSPVPSATRCFTPPATEANLAETAKLVEAEDRRIITVVGDVRAHADLASAVDRAEEEFGGIDIVVANAGVNTYGAFWRQTEQDWDAVVETNLKGVWNTVRAAAPGMIARGRGGSIILTSSVGGIRGSVSMAAYVASKHGVTGLARAFANELSEYGIRVNSIHPGAVPGTGMASGVALTIPRPPHHEELFRMGVSAPLPGTILVEDIAAAVAWLASDESRFVTGIQLPIDAGSLNKP
jgi:NAD(P)-dependent dehydrogenase (short-subunit alcohol dehydrogenase family)